MNCDESVPNIMLLFFATVVGLSSCTMSPPPTFWHIPSFPPVLGVDGLCSNFIIVNIFVFVVLLWISFFKLFVNSFFWVKGQII